MLLLQAARIDLLLQLLIVIAIVFLDFGDQVSCCRIFGLFLTAISIFASCLWCRDAKGMREIEHADWRRTL